MFTVILKEEVFYMKHYETENYRLAKAWAH